MDINLPILGYYPENDLKFIDPMFVPYQTAKLPIDQDKCFINASTWKNMGNPNYVHPDHFRMDWNLDMQKLHPNDPCPAGWMDKGENNALCTRVPDPAMQGSFYTDQQFAVQYQYPNGYTLDSRYGSTSLPPKQLENRLLTPHRNILPVFEQKNDSTDSPTFKAASLNPRTGNYTLYYNVKQTGKEGKYGILPSRWSYLGI